MKSHVASVLCVLACFALTDGFNVETRHYTVYREASNSMFGFSVAEHVDRNQNGWVIVGAPQAQTNQPDIEEGGAVYRCDITRDDACTQIIFDQDGNHRHNKSKAGEIDNKSRQWFGATVSSSYVAGGPILACAPRYIWYSTSLSRREPIGTCYVTAASFDDPKEISPCRTRHWGYHRQGSCQAGLGAAISKDGERMIIGAPGSWYWQGQVIAQWVNGLKKVLFTSESPSYADDSYLGYSVATGEFLGDGDKGFAVGMPRGNELVGKVLLFTSTMSNWMNVSGIQMGAYFGYSIISCDVDGDGRDDLIVGAPMYTIPDNSEMTFETGRIYILRQGVDFDKKFRLMETRDGTSNRGRFGLSLASLNDIDRDGYQDFAVGAPYGGANGRGVVYIYHGSRDGVLETYSQVIDAEEVGSSVSTFGFSLAGGMDLDRNEYPDLVVGSYESSSAMYFRSRPVVEIDAFVKFDSTSKLISLENKGCVLNDGTAVPCLTLDACLNFTGRGARDQHRFDVQYVLDSKKSKGARLFFVEHESKSSMNKTIVLRRNEQICRPFKVYIAPNIRDKLTSIDAEMRLSLLDEQEDFRTVRDPVAPLRAVLGARTSKKDSLSIFKDCGEDNICVPDLQMTVKPSVQKYLLGSGDKLELDVMIKNEGEDAFEAMYFLELPSGIDYININRIDKTEVPVQCSAPKASNNNTMRCDIGNPLPRDNFVNFKVILQPVTSQGMKPVYDFRMEVNATNPDDVERRGDNRYNLALPIWVQTELFIEGQSKPKDVYFDMANFKGDNVTTESEFGPLVTHNYTIRNDGPSNILNAEAYLIWPAQTLAGDELVYLLEQPETSPSIVCETANSNYLSLKLENKQKLYGESGSEGYASGSGGHRNVDWISSEGNRIEKQDNRDAFNAPEFTDKASGTIVSSSSSRGSYSSGGGSSSSSGSYDRSYSISGGSATGSSSRNHSSSYQDGYGATNGQLIIEQAGSIDSQQTGGYVTGLGPQTGIRTGQFEESRNRGMLESGSSGSSGSSGAVYGTTQYGEIREQTGRFQHGWDQDNHQQENRRTHEQQSNIEIERLKYEEAQRQERLRYEESPRQLEIQRAQIERERQDANRRLELQKQREEAERQRQDRITPSEPIYGVAKHYSTDTGRSQGGRFEQGSSAGNYDGISGNREYTFESTGSNVHTGGSSHSGGSFHSGGSAQSGIMASSEGLERLFSTLTSDAAAVTSYFRDGKEYVTFDGRYRVSQGKQYIQFRNNQAFELFDSYGSPSFSTSDNEDYSERFSKIEGELIIEEDRNLYIRLKDGRKFRIPGTYTYTEERKYTVGGGSSEGYPRTSDYSKEITHHSRSEGHNVEPFETVHREESYGREYKSEEHRTSATRDHVYGTMGSSYGDNAPMNHLSRYPRENKFTSIDELERLTEWNRDFEAGQRTGEFRQLRRHRRADSPDYVGDSTIILPKCPAAKCVSLRCTLGPLEKGQEVWIAARSRLNAKTLDKIAFNEKLKVSTQLTARVTRQPFIGETDNPEVKSHEIFTTVHPSAAATAPDIVPLWVVVLSACAGTIILLLLVYLLYKCGFFKRNRPTDAPERQPLNRNGHYSN